MSTHCPSYVQFGDCAVLKRVSTNHVLKHHEHLHKGPVVLLVGHMVHRHKMKRLQSANEKVLALFGVIRPQHRFKLLLPLFRVLNVHHEAIPKVGQCAVSHFKLCIQSTEYTNMISKVAE